ncbi:MAG: hypothetical protein V4658_06340 [Bacteroidota bacterium]
MKKITSRIMLLIGITTIIACGNKQPKVQEKAEGWRQEAKQEFLSACINHINEDSVKAAKICDCLLSNVMTSHPEAHDVDTLQQHDWEEILAGSGCIDPAELHKDSASFWGQAEKEAFLKSCTEASVKNGDKAEDAKTFCDCALEKTIHTVPNPHLTSGFTEEEYTRILKTCKK